MQQLSEGSYRSLQKSKRILVADTRAEYQRTEDQQIHKDIEKEEKDENRYVFEEIQLEIDSQDQTWEEITIRTCQQLTYKKGNENTTSQKYNYLVSKHVEEQLEQMDKKQDTSESREYFTDDGHLNQEQIETRSQSKVESSLQNPEQVTTLPRQIILEETTIMEQFVQISNLPYRMVAIVLDQNSIYQQENPPEYEIQRLNILLYPEQIKQMMELEESKLRQIYEIINYDEIKWMNHEEILNLSMVSINNNS